MKIQPFKSGERICFIGDSITAATGWIAHLADCYSQNTTEQIELYPCGISGGSCISGRDYFDEQTAPWQPNTVVIKLGMNDVGGSFYGENGQGGDLQWQAKVLAEYKENLDLLVDKIKSAGVGRIILLAPTPYDEMMTCEAKNHVGWMAALRSCAKFMEELADKSGCEFYDLGGDMLALLKEAYALGNQNPLIKEDRVHPNDLGHAVMARLILTAQGFDGYQITASDIVSGRAGLTMSQKAAAFYELAKEEQSRWTTEWLVGRYSPDQSKEAKYKFITEDYVAAPEKYPDYEQHGAYFVSLAMSFNENLAKLDKMRQAIKDANAQLFGAVPEPLPYVKAFEQLGFGMFVHFGLYSKLNMGEWTFSDQRRTMDEYAPLKDSFEVNGMAQIVATAKAAGCKYVTLTTRHHEGFSLYDTKGLSDFDIMHTPTGRDLVQEFVDECRKADLVPFFYHTTLDWWNGDFENDFEKYLEYLYKSVELLCTNYGKIGGMWFDGNWSKPDADWQEDRLYKMIHRLQPDAVIINNTGLHDRGAFGDQEIDAVTYERGMPDAKDQRGRSKYVAGEMCETLCDHWGAADDINFKSVKALIEELCECRKVGANFLLNIGPNADGSVPLMQRATMECIGRWMSLYGKAVYNGRPFVKATASRNFMLRDVEDEHTAYLFVLEGIQSGGSENVSIADGVNKGICFDSFGYGVASIEWMDNGQPVAYEQQGDSLRVIADNFDYGKSYCVRVATVKLN